MRGRQILQRSQSLIPYSGSASRPVGMSIGLAVWQPAPGEDVDHLMARADTAMYEAKRGGKGTFYVAPAAGASP